MHFKIKITDPKPDKENKIQFVMDWITESGRKRGQYFRTNLDEHLKHLESQDHTFDLEK